MKNILYIILFSIMFTSFNSCSDFKDKTTTLEIIDNERHYYPIVRGQDLEVIFTIKNVGEHPFILSDLLISCGCIVAKRSSINTIPAGRERKIAFTYNSTKNIGFVKHHIELYGNLKDTNKVELIFDTNVVPAGAYVKDYEELFEERRRKGLDFEGLSDGDENNKGYYMDSDFK